jgi:hypothetical protein
MGLTAAGTPSTRVNVSMGGKRVSKLELLTDMVLVLRLGCRLSPGNCGVVYRR